MSEWERIMEERTQEKMARQNTAIINRLLRGKRKTTQADAVRIMRNKYSKYGKRQINERLLSDMCVPETDS